MSITATAEKTMWDTLYSFFGNAFAAAAAMGQFYAESGLVSNNLQNSGNTKLNLTDAQYTSQVDAGTYTNFVHDGYGYGLAQWTYYSRKQGLLDYVTKKKKSIGDQAAQLEYFEEELSGSYKSLLKSLKAATSVKEASDALLTQYEKPADQSSSVKTKRASYGQTYYDKYAPAASSVPYTVKVTIDDLNIRKGPGIDYDKTGKYTGKGVFTIVEEDQGKISTKGTIGTWGKLKSGAGWICLSISGVTKTK